MYHKLVSKVDCIETKIASTTRFINKLQYDQKNKKKKDVEHVHKKVPNTTDLVKNTDYNFNMTEIEDEIPDIIGLVNNITHGSRH